MVSLIGALLDEARLQGQPGQVGAPPAAGLVADAVEVGADGAHADIELAGDLGVGAALGDQGDQFPFPGAELPASWRRLRLRAAVSMAANSAAVARVIAAPRSSAARVRAGPSACLAFRMGAWRRCASCGRSMTPVRLGSARRGPPTA